MTEQLTHPEVKTHLGDSGGILSLQLTCKLQLALLEQGRSRGPAHSCSLSRARFEGLCMDYYVIPRASWKSACEKDVEQKNGMTWCLWEVRPEPQEYNPRSKSSSTAEATGPSILMKQWNISLQCRTHPTQVKVPHSAGLLHWT